MSDDLALTAPGDVTQMLRRLADGEQRALDELFPAVYAELRRIARGQRYRGAGRSPLNTTALLHEAYLRFAKNQRHDYNHRQHFFAVAAKAMRQILLDEAKSAVAAKRGGGEVKLEPIDPEQLKVDEQAELLIALDQQLEKLGRMQPRVRTVVEYRFFGGMTEIEIAEVLGVDVRTIRRDWAKARAWLAVELDLA